ncbi:MAG: hypothetical protein QXY07_02665 [Candidatus Bathyarchaeia archaeon]
MPKCPNCGRKIDWLINLVCENIEKYIFKFDERGEPQYDYIDGWGWSNYICPMCGELLFTDDEKAMKFLKPKNQKQNLRQDQLRNQRKKASAKP